jgi:hypothetical protein
MPNKVPVHTSGNQNDDEGDMPDYPDTNADKFG